ncbi:glycoside hydrolase family 28 protein [Pinibacter soli]|uniref:Glycoside hydrolase family 28 protein n=1 Tax=Pinibacter soli TaxID=3044211 RepID=A0ABT6RF79_9BACT|nr:glycoside hydrolase family 28 protein [Pinibacter soli]MDI3321121.1 glycoside hydrolase family 28 protein [Pinibacter soli]
MKFLRLTIVLGAMSLCMSAFAQDKDMTWYVKNAPFAMPQTVIPSFPSKTFNIVDYGGVNDGHSLNTQAFDKVITACSQAGGGRVIIPPGVWLTAPIQLKSNVDLHVMRGAIVLFTPDRNLFPMIKSGSGYMVQPPVYGANLENVAITGEGIFDGSGESWRPLKKSKATEAQWKQWNKTGVVSKDGSVWWPSKEAMNGEEYLKTLKGKKDATEADYLPAKDFLRPKLVVITGSKNVLIDGPTFKNSPNFVLNPQNCVNLTIRNIQVNNEWWAQNGDGIDISASKNVVIYKCTVNAGDDGICMKSSGGKNGEAQLQNVVIADCIVYHAHGGFVIGSNTDGGMKNVFVSNCNFIGTDIGIRVKSNAGRGGLVRDIYIDNIFMHDIQDEAILFDTYYDNVGAGQDKEKVKNVATDKVPEFCNFYISNVVCNKAETAFSITGLPEMPVHNLEFKNVVISAKDGFVSKDASNISLKNVKIITDANPVFKTVSSKNINVQ